MPTNPIYAYFNSSLALSLDTSLSSLNAGAVDEDQLYVHFVGKTHVDYPTATVTFKRSDGTISPELIMQQTSFVYSGAAFPAGTYANSYTFSFYDDWILALSGPLEVTVRLYGVNGNILVSGKMTLSVQSSVFSPETTITPNQLQSLIDQINGLATNDNAVKIILPDCRNDDTVQLTVGMPVYASGSIGGSGKIKIKRASADYTIPQSNKLFGVVMETINAGSDGDVMILGEVQGVNTVGLTEGQPIFVSTTPGQLTSTAPQAPNHRIVVGGVIRTNSNGIIYVKQQLGLDLAELCDVYIGSPNNGEILRYSSVNNRWQNSDTLTTAETNITNLQNSKVDKTQTIIGIDLQDNIDLNEFKTAVGNATTSLAGLMSATDKINLDNLVAVLGVPDGNNIVDTLQEILSIFNNYPEGADLLSEFAKKVDKVAGKELSTNDLTNTLKTNYDTAYNHSQIVTGNPHNSTPADIGAEPANANIQAHVTITDGTNPHNTTFANIASLPTSIAGYGITDAYTKTQTDNLLTGKADIVDGKIPAGQLPSYVDDVLETYARNGATPAASDWLSLTGVNGTALTAEAGKIYVIIGATDTDLIGKTYRWAGSTYAVVGNIALGETAATAFPGNRGLATETKTNNIVSGAQTLTDTRITNSDVLISPLIVNSVASTTASLQEWKVNNATQGLLTKEGRLALVGGISHYTGNAESDNRAYVNVSSTGTIISRNINDATNINPALTINQAQGASDILRLQFAGANKLEVTKDGFINQNGTRLFHQTVDNTNTFFGSGVANTTLTGTLSTVIGRQAFENATTANSITAVGYRSLRNTTTGSRTVGVGLNSGLSNTTGQNNTFVGTEAGNNVSQDDDGSNMTALGYQAYTDKPNQMVFGNDSVTEFVFNRNTGALVLMPQTQISSATFPPLQVQRTSTGTDAPLGAVLFKHKTSGNMLNDFGVNFEFAIEDDANVNNVVARVGAVRSGADNSGRLIFKTTNAGTDTEKMTIMPDGKVGIGTFAPVNALSVISSSNTDGIQIRRSSNSVGEYARLGFRINSAEENTNFAEIRAVRTDRAVSTDTDLRFITRSNSANLEVMRMRDDGLVGIGTTNPLTKLNVVGDATTGTTGTSSVFRIGRPLTNNVSFDQYADFKIGRYENAGGAYQSYTRLDIDLRDNSTSNSGQVNVMTLTNAGRVGIGTSAPAQLLSVVSSSNGDGIQIRRNSVTTNDYGVLGFRINTSELVGNFAEIRGVRTNRAVAADTDLSFHTITNGVLGERMRIRDDGLVGINETSPSAQLQVKSGSATILDRVGLIVDSFTGQTADLQRWSVNGTSVKAKITADGFLESPEVRNLTTANNSRIYLNDTGTEIRRNVNSSDPALIVNQHNSSATGNIQEWQKEGSSKLAVNGSGEIINATSSSNGKIAIPTSGVKIERNVADANPTLRVNNDEVTATGNIQEWAFDNGNKAYVDNNGDFYNDNGTYGTISDERLKENIINARNYTEDLMKLRVVKYSLKKEKATQPTHLGFIAQEFEQVFPNMVDTTKTKELDDQKSIKMSVLIPMLVKTIQELKKEIDELKKK